MTATAETKSNRALMAESLGINWHLEKLVEKLSLARPGDPDSYLYALGGAKVCAEDLCEMHGRADLAERLRAASQPNHERSDPRTPELAG